MDEETTVQRLKDEVRRFCEDRDWDQFHDAKDLAIGIATEAGELLQRFRFLTPEQVALLMKDPEARSEVEAEIADVAIFILRLAQRYGIDLSEALQRKLEENDRRYPVDDVRGSNRKRP